MHRVVLFLILVSFSLSKPSARRQGVLYDNLSSVNNVLKGSIKAFFTMDVSRSRNVIRLNIHQIDRDARSPKVVRRVLYDKIILLSRGSVFKCPNKSGLVEKWRRSLRSQW